MGENAIFSTFFLVIGEQKRDAIHQRTRFYTSTVLRYHNLKFVFFFCVFPALKMIFLLQFLKLQSARVMNRVKAWKKGRVLKLKTSHVLVILGYIIFYSR